MFCLTNFRFGCDIFNIWQCIWLFIHVLMVPFAWENFMSNTFFSLILLLESGIFCVYDAKACQSQNGKKVFSFCFWSFSLERKGNSIEIESKGNFCIREEKSINRAISVHLYRGNGDMKEKWKTKFYLHWNRTLDTHSLRNSINSTDLMKWVRKPNR